MEGSLRIGLGFVGMRCDRLGEHPHRCFDLAAVSFNNSMFEYVLSITWYIKLWH